MKILFATDLDNTLIYSHKRVYSDDICVERYKNEEFSFMPKTTYHRLYTLSDQIDIMPVTTRSKEQYQRLRLPPYIEYALVANGSMRLHKKQVVHNEVIANISENPLGILMGILEKEKNRRNALSARIENASFIYFTYETEQIAQQAYVEMSILYENMIVVRSGRKVYILMPWATKGNISDMRKDYDCIIAAGDSPLDIPLLQQADYAIVPTLELADALANAIRQDMWHGYKKAKLKKPLYVHEIDNHKETFPEFITDSVHNIVHEKL